MKPGFAIDFSHDGIGLLRRGAEGWVQIGTVSLDDAALPQRLAALRDRAGAGAASAAFCKLIIPNSQILYADVRAPGPSAAARRAAILKALEGQTPYAAADLTFDWSGTGRVVQVAIVARETLAEAEAFARSNGFAPAAFVAMPPEDAFGGEPFFGSPETLEAELGPDDRLVRDQDPVRIVAAPADGAEAEAEAEAEADNIADPAPADIDAAPQETAEIAMDEGKLADKPDDPEPIAAMAAVEASETGAPPVGDVEPADPGRKTPTEPAAMDGAEPDDSAAQVSDTEIPTAESAAPEGENATSGAPVDLGAPDAAVRGDDPKGDAGGDEVEAASAAAPAADSTDGPPAEPPAPPVVGAGSAPAGKAPKLGGAKRGKGEDSAETGPDTAPKISAGDRPEGGAAAEAEDWADEWAYDWEDPLADPEATLAEDGPDAEAAPKAVSLTVFGARRAVADPARPRHLRQGLTVALILLIAALGTWWALFAHQNAVPAPSSDVTLLATPDGEASAPSPSGVLTAPDANVVQTAPEATSASPETAPPARPEALATPAKPPPSAGPAPLTAADVPALPPSLGPMPGTDGQATPNVLMPDAGLSGRGTPELPEGGNSGGETGPAPLATPLPFASLAAPAPAPDATGEPQVPVIAGRPAVVPPPRPRTATEADTAAAAAVPPEADTAPAPDPLRLFRPRPRPAGLVPAPVVLPETAPAPEPAPAAAARPQDDATLAPGTEALPLPVADPALAGRKPRARPASIAAAAALAAPATPLASGAPADFAGASAQAVATSRRPPPRSANIADRVAAAVAASVTIVTPEIVASAAPAPDPDPEPAPGEEIDEPEPTSAAPNIPTRASVAKQATVANVLKLNQVNLISIAGSSSGRRALVRMNNGRVVRVEVGDRLDGGKVAAITDRQLTYVKSGKTIVLEMPHDG